jgi:hypothetical protein
MVTAASRSRAIIGEFQPRVKRIEMEGLPGAKRWGRVEVSQPQMDHRRENAEKNRNVKGAGAL